MPNIPLSKQYTQGVKNLYIQHGAKEITDEELSHHLDDLRKREIEAQAHIGHVLHMQALLDIEKEVEEEINRNNLLQKEALRTQEEAIKAAERVRIAEEARDKKEKERLKLKEEIDKEKRERDKKIKQAKEIQDLNNSVEGYIERLERNARKWQTYYTWLQIILLSFSATTAAIAAIDGVPRWIVAIVGLIATIAGGLLTTFKIQDRIYASRKAVAEVTLERQRYDRGIEEYKDMDEVTAYLRLSRSIISIQGQEMLQEVELWNPKKDEKREKTVPDSVQEEPKSKEAEEKLNDVPPEIGLSGSTLVNVE